MPSALGGLPRLYGVSLNDNQLTGHLPAALGAAGTLWGLNLTNNQLTGPIPGAWRGAGQPAPALSWATTGSAGRSTTAWPNWCRSTTWTWTITASRAPSRPASRTSTACPGSTCAPTNSRARFPKTCRATYLLLDNNQLSGELPASYGTTGNYQILFNNNNITRIPQFNQPIGYPNIQLGLTGNYLAFDSYEPNQNTPGQYQFWDYVAACPGGRHAPGGGPGRRPPGRAHRRGPQPLPVAAPGGGSGWMCPARPSRT
ncbi:MAG: hypothetical protein WKG07_08080 [Hymenobacter sp.]